MHFALASEGDSHTHQALQGLNLEIARGEKIGLVGRNGASKSTLPGLWREFIPRIRQHLAGTELSVALLSIGLGFKNDLTGRENDYSQRCCRYAQGRGRSRLDAMGNSRNSRFYDEPVKTYSSGMRSRLGFATGLLLDTDILLLDEIYRWVITPFAESPGSTDR